MGQTCERFFGALRRPSSCCANVAPTDAPQNCTLARHADDHALVACQAASAGAAGSTSARCADDLGLLGLAGGGSVWRPRRLSGWRRLHGSGDAMFCGDLMACRDFVATSWAASASWARRLHGLRQLHGRLRRHHGLWRRWGLGDLIGCGAIMRCGDLARCCDLMGCGNSWDVASRPAHARGSRSGTPLAPETEGPMSEGRRPRRSHCACLMFRTRGRHRRTAPRRLVGRGAAPSAAARSSVTRAPPTRRLLVEATAKDAPRSAPRELDMSV